MASGKKKSPMYIFLYGTSAEIKFVCLFSKQLLVNQELINWTQKCYYFSCQNIESSRQRSPTQPLQKDACCRRRAIYPTREMAIFVIFFFIVPIHRYFFYYFYRLSRHTQTYCKNQMCVSKCPILKFIWDFENRLNWI